MKRSVTVLALAGLCGAASAQSSVTIYGIVDATLQRGSGSLTDRIAMGSGGNTTSRIGFRGVEDLGGGLRAGFNLEAQIFVDTGEGQPTNTNNQASGTTVAPPGTQGLTFARRSTVSLENRFGEIRMGRDFTAHYRNRVESDPFGNAGVGSIQPFVGSIGGPVSTRASNMIGYFLPPDIGGLYGQLQHYRGENAGNVPEEGTGTTARVGYLWGALNVSAAAGRTKYNRTATVGDILTQNLGVQYQAGPVKLMAGLYRDTVYRNARLRAKGWAAGAVWAVGVGDIKFALSEYGTDAAGSPETRKLSLGYVYNVSKRTALYGTFALLKNQGGATAALNGATTAPNGRSSGLDLGIRHAF